MNYVMIYAFLYHSFVDMLLPVVVSSDSDVV